MRKQYGWVGDAVCPREGCPSTAHDVWFHYNRDGEVIATSFECRVCGAMEKWVDGRPENAE